MKKDLRSMTLEQLQEEMKQLKVPAFRAQQIYQWLHKHMADGTGEMTNLPLSLREILDQNYDITVLKEELKLVSQLDGTRKYVFALQDGNCIESVLMRYKYGNSVCISSQVGCRMGCHFCASTLDGLVRNLQPGEMLEQIYQISRDIGERISHVVVMGTGEPMDNRENLTAFIRLLSDEKGYGISQRNITVSTCGLVPQILEFAKEHLQVTLALSLHAPNDELRRTMMPVSRRYTIEETLAACDEYFKETGRRMSYEYSLIKDVNDGKAQAEELCRLLKGRNCHVNLIPVNPIKEREYETSEGPSVENFKKTLEKNGINVTIRRKMGADIDSACGQLRRRARI